MKKIASLTVNNDKLEKGMYISRIDGDVITYDIRMKKPNGGDYLGNGELHTFEHLFATYARNDSLKDNVIYFGPMGCRTGFYLLMRNTSNDDALEYIKSVIKDCMNHEGEIPGSKKIECGNYLAHNAEKAHNSLLEFYNRIKTLQVNDLFY